MKKIEDGPCLLRRPDMSSPEQAEVLLCELLREMSTVPNMLRNLGTDELGRWWAEHQRDDRRERASKQKEAARQRRLERRRQRQRPRRGGVRMPRRGDEWRFPRIRRGVVGE